MFGQLKHAVLNNVQSRFFVANMIKRTLKSPLLNVLQKIGELVFSGQWNEP
jgi:hypothetical protein